MKTLKFTTIALFFSLMVTHFSWSALPVQKVYFTNLKDGQKISNGYVVKFAVKDMKVLPAGEVVEGSGHHHILIDQGPVPAGTAIPADETHIHFGKGQTEFKFEGLKDGPHTLTLQFADGQHKSYGPAYSAQAKIIIKDSKVKKVFQDLVKNLKPKQQDKKESQEK